MDSKPKESGCVEEITENVIDPSKPAQKRKVAKLYDAGEETVICLADSTVDNEDTLDLATAVRVLT